MIKVLLKFWPVLIPFVLYFIWRRWKRKSLAKAQATSNDTSAQPLSAAEARVWIITLAAALAIALLCMIFMMAGIEEDTEYTPVYSYNIQGNIQGTL